MKISRLFIPTLALLSLLTQKTTADTAQETSQIPSFQNPISDGPYHPQVDQSEVSSIISSVLEKKDSGEAHSESGSHSTEDEPHRDTVPSLEKPHEFDIDEFLQSLDSLGCKEKGEPGQGDYEQLCAQRLQEETFRPLGEYNIDHNGFYDYVNKNIYMPLAYQMQRPNSLSNLLLDLIFLKQRNMLFTGKPTNTSYKEFEEGILGRFQDLQGKTSDMDKNQEAISQLMIDILKRFHLYWNELRYKDQVDKVAVDTKEIMRSLLRSYQVKEKFLFEVTKTLVEHVKTAYIRFLKAHQSVRILNKNAAGLISKLISDRYGHVTDAIKYSQFNEVKLVHELTWFLQLQESFYVVNYKMGINEPKNIISFNTQVVEAIRARYDLVATNMREVDKARLTDIRDFTATLLLKMKHMEFVAFKYNSITEFVNLSKVMIHYRQPVIVKLYYEVMDNMLMIPKHCVNFLVLKKCAYFETNKLLRHLGSKYMLKRSVGGWGVFDYLQNILKQLYSKANDMVFSNWTIFKAYYYQNLFAIMYNFKKQFLINDEDCVEDLESLLGTTIDKFKADNGTSKLNFGLIDQLDKELYDKFLDVKAYYNSYAPFDKDPQILASLQNDLTKFFANFKEEYKKEIGEDFIILVDHLKDTVEEWKKNTLAAEKLSVQVGELPLHAINLYPQHFVNVKTGSGDQVDHSVAKEYQKDAGVVDAKKKESAEADVDESGQHQNDEEGSGQHQDDEEGSGGNNESGDEERKERKLHSNEDENAENEDKQEENKPVVKLATPYKDLTLPKEVTEKTKDLEYIPNHSVPAHSQLTREDINFEGGISPF